ncbi:MAG TPA: hypothetical protein VHZ73_01745 [Vicinamibacterales bacterium]|jgi:hypothetical protein|nr:hypothetical protein [Vicinamibacterales bacterium]
MLSILLSLACIGCDASNTAAFQTHAELQALYEEMAETVAHATVESPATVSGVLITPDWTFVDASGARHSFSEAQALVQSALRVAPFDTITNTIDKLSLATDTAIVVVKVTVAARAPALDAQTKWMGQFDGWHEVPKVPLPRPETRTFKDTWVKAGNSWKMQTREEVGKPETRQKPTNVY